jgi:L-alanine-DL-glutamate epimerase-like enolase superfamily enzyme
MAALHIAAAQSPATVPMVEYLVNLQSVKQVLFKNMLAPEHGHLPLPQQPGLGLVIDEDKIDQRHNIIWKSQS